jgi:hypothetical protein
VAGPPGWGLGVRLTISPCKKKFVENFLGGKILEETKAHLLGCGAADDDDYISREITHLGDYLYLSDCFVSA